MEIQDQEAIKEMEFDMPVIKRRVAGQLNILDYK
jgi:hypothetical protein